MLRLDILEKAGGRPKVSPLQSCPPVKGALHHVSMLARQLANVSQVASVDLMEYYLKKPMLHCNTPISAGKPLSPYPTVLIDGEALDEARRKSSILVPMTTDRGSLSKRRSTRSSSILSTKDMLQFLNLPPSYSPSRPHLLGLHPSTRLRSRSLCYMSTAQHRGAQSARPFSADTLRPRHFPLTLHSRHRQNPYCSLGMQLQSSTSLSGAGLYNSVEGQSEQCLFGAGDTRALTASSPFSSNNAEFVLSSTSLDMPHWKHPGTLLPIEEEYPQLLHRAHQLGES